MAQITIDYGSVSGGISNVIQAFIGYHPHNTGSGIKPFDSRLLNSEYCDYDTANNTINIKKDFKAHIYWGFTGGVIFPSLYLFPIFSILVCLLE